MTKVFAINADNDLYLDSSNNIAVISGLVAVEQACLTASQTQLGECVLETGRGLPNFQAIWVGAPNYSLWRSRLQNALTQVGGVDAVKSITLARVGDALQYAAEIETKFGNTAIRGIIDA